MTEANAQSDSVVDKATTDQEAEKSNDGGESSTSRNTPYVVKRLVGQRDKLRVTNSSLDAENNDLAGEIVRQAAEIKQLQTQAPQTLASPSLEQFGDDIAGFQAATQAHFMSQSTALVDSRLNQFAANQAEQNRLNTSNNSVNQHYDRVQKMAKPDYEQAESNAINILGSEFVNGIVENSTNSEEILFMLGNDTNQAQQLKNLFDSNPVRATMEIGRLSATAGSFNKESRPEPEDALEGGKLPNVTHSNLKKKYEQMLDDATNGGNTTGLREIRKQMREAGLL